MLRRVPLRCTERPHSLPRHRAIPTLNTRVASKALHLPILHARDYSKGIKRRAQATRDERHAKREKEIEDPTVVVNEPEEIKPPWQAERWSEVRLLIVHPVTESARYSHADYLLSEAVGLAEACNWKVLNAIKVPLHQTNSATFFGTGKVEELGQMVAQTNANVVYVDAFLNPAQLAKLAQRWAVPTGRELRVFDRFAVILEIFSLRAQTRESKLQVEMAWIEYQRTHLVGKHAQEFKGEKQKGGRGFTSGSGETQLEIDRRRLSDRAAHVKKQLQSIAQTHELHMLHRARLENIPLIAVVGYTNVGKSMLVNKLTGAELQSRNELFTSLSPFHRVAVLPSLGVKAMFMDTVGFISNLPHALFAAFKATLDEIRTAQLVLHVRDVAHPESAFQKEQVHRVLRDMKIGSALMKSHVEVWNKIDLLEPASLEALLEQAALEAKANKRTARTGAESDRLGDVQSPRKGNAADASAAIAPAAIIPISAIQGTGLPQLVREVEERVVEASGVQAFDIEISAMEVVHVQYLYANASVVSRADVVDEKNPSDARVKVRVTFSAVSLQEYKAKHKPLSMRKVPHARLIRTHVAPASEAKKIAA